MLRDESYEQLKNTYYTRGLFFKNSNQPSHALNVFNHALELDPKNPNIHYQLSLININFDIELAIYHLVQVILLLEKSTTNEIFLDLIPLLENKTVKFDKILSTELYQVFSAIPNQLKLSHIFNSKLYKIIQNNKHSSPYEQCFIQAINSYTDNDLEGALAIIMDAARNKDLIYLENSTYKYELEIQTLEGKIYLAQGRLKEAIERFTTCFNKAENRLQRYLYHSLRAYCYQELNQNAQADSELDFIKQNLTTASDYLLLAKHYFELSNKSIKQQQQMKFIELTLKTIDLAIKKDIKDGHSWYQIGLIYTEFNYELNAKAAYSFAIDFGYQNGVHKTPEAASLPPPFPPRTPKKITTQEPEIKPAIKINLEDEWTIVPDLNILVQCKNVLKTDTHHKENLENACKLLKLAIKKGGFFKLDNNIQAEHYVLYAQCLEKLDTEHKFSNLITSNFKLAINLDPKSHRYKYLFANYSNELGIFLAKKRNYLNALNAFSEAIANSNNQENKTCSYFNRGKTYFISAPFEKDKRNSPLELARMDFKEVLKMHPTNCRAILFLKKIDDLTGEKHHYFKHKFINDRKSKNDHFYRGLFALTRGDLYYAIECFNKALELEPFQNKYDSEIYYQNALAANQLYNVVEKAESKREFFDLAVSGMANAIALGKFTLQINRDECIDKFKAALKDPFIANSKIGEDLILKAILAIPNKIFRKELLINCIDNRTSLGRLWKPDPRSLAKGKLLEIFTILESPEYQAKKQVDEIWMLTLPNLSPNSDLFPAKPPKKMHQNSKTGELCFNGNTINDGL